MNTNNSYFDIAVPADQNIVKIQNDRVYRY